MKPFATLGSEISKVRDRVKRGAESLRPSTLAGEVRDQRDRLLAKLGEQTFRLIAEKKLTMPKMLQDSVERLAHLLGVQIPAPGESVAPPDVAAAASEVATPQEASASAPFPSAASDSSIPIAHPVDEPHESVDPVPSVAAPAKIEAAPAVSPSPAKKTTGSTKKKGGKRRDKR